MKGKIVWILTFLSFLAGLNVFNAIMLSTLHNGDFLIEFLISGLSLGFVSVIVYFSLSIIATLILLGSTVYFIFKGLPADPDVLQRLGRLESNLDINTNLLENTQMGFFRRLEENEKVNDEAFRKMRMDLEEARKEMRDTLLKQKETLQSVQEESNENVAIIKKQANDIVTVKKRIEKIVKNLPATSKTARLTSKSKLSTVRDVKPSLAYGLKNLGIKTVGQFITMDPMIIAEKTMEPPDIVTGWQAKAQLLMVPGLSPNDAELLVKVGITSRRELANQDPVQLCRTITGIANVYVEQKKMLANQVPTIDDVWSWIKLAQP